MMLEKFQAQSKLEQVLESLEIEDTEPEEDLLSSIVETMFLLLELWEISQVLKLFMSADLTFSNLLLEDMLEDSVSGPKVHLENSTISLVLIRIPLQTLPFQPMKLQILIFQESLTPTKFKVLLEIQEFQELTTKLLRKTH